MRFRLLLISIGLILVVGTWTFPFWYPLLPRGDGAQQELFPDLAPALQAAFGVLPVDQQQAYLTLRETEPDIALAMVSAALSPAATAPSGDAEMPELVGSMVAAQGGLRGVDAIRSATGDVTIYQVADGSWALRLENFSMTNGPDLRVALSTNPNPLTLEELRQENLDVDVGALKGITGNQNYTIPPEIDVREYRSVVIYNADLPVIYATATLFILSF
jgi:hypothetical protein